MTAIAKYEIMFNKNLGFTNYFGDENATEGEARTLEDAALIADRRGYNPEVWPREWREAVG
ncbi:MAG: hypothetical protein D6711_13790 [Chloroflexi bacterium]|nr:MAG: hypothetical protein D6711_13790 [Chloroflexota bacterium]